MATIGIIGLWHLGEVYSAGFAELGHEVVGLSDDGDVIGNLNRNIPPLAEPGLAELIAKHRAAGRLSYTTEWNALGDCNAVWLTFDTPVDEHDEADVSIIMDAVKKAAPHLRQGVLLGASSQLPVGTSKKICEEVRIKRPDLKFEYAYVPENLRLGDALKGFLEPERLVIGADTAEARARAKELFTFPAVPALEMSVISAELAKHAMNAFLATCISFTNDIADIAERTGGDIEEIVRALRADSRVGPRAYLFAGLGFSGATLARDMKILLRAGDEKKVSLPVVRGAFEKNRARSAVAQTRLEKRWGSVKGKTLALLGLTYKGGTPTLRRSQALEVEKMLRDAGASLRLYDSLANQEEVRAAAPSPFFRDVYEAARGTDAALILAPSKEFRALDFAKLASLMRGALLFDTQNVLCDKEKDIKAAGITYMSIGRQ